MKRKVYGYGAYRGRGQGSAGLKLLIGVLAVLLVLAAAAFFLAERYMVYGDDGKARLELPFFQKEDPGPSQLPTLVTPAPSQGTSAPTPAAAPPSPGVTPPAQERPEVVLPVMLKLEALYDGTAGEQVTEGGGSAAVFDMKGIDGKLDWVSESELAVAARVSAGDPELNGKIRAAAEADGVYRVAKISCFKDNEITNADPSMAMVTESGVRWLDIDSTRWISPASEKGQDYVIALCQELADLGFDEILLENAGYPTRGKMQYLKKDASYDAERFEEVITGFYRKLTDAMEGTGTALSVVYDPDTTALSGQSEKAIRDLGMSVVIYDETGRLSWQA